MRFFFGRALTFEKTIKRQVLPQAPSPTMTSFRRSSDMFYAYMSYAAGAETKFADIGQRILAVNCECCAWAKTLDAEPGEIAIYWSANKVERDRSEIRYD